MKTIQSITVTAVVLMFALSVFAVPAAAAHDPKDPDHDFIPGGESAPGDGDVFVHANGLIVPGDGDVFVHANGLIVPGDKVLVTDSENMDNHAKKGVMPGDNVQLPDTISDEKIVPGGGVAYDAPPEDRFLKAKKAFDGNENWPDSVFDGDDDEEFQDGSDPILAP